MSDPAVPHVVLTRAGPATPWVGQLVPIDVALWRPYTGSGELPPFSFDELDVPGAIALFREHAPPPSQLDQDGVTYLVQHRTLLVFAQRDGTITLPPIRARFDDPAQHVPVRVSSQPLSFSATLPRTMQRDAALVVARSLTIESTLDRKLEGLAVGDGFTRTVVLSADDSDPVMLPVLVFEPVEGLHVYPSEPRVLSSGERDVIGASRRYAATYVVERVGHYELPALHVHWLDPGTGRYSTAHAAALAFWARPNPSLGLNAFGNVPGLGLSVLLGSTLLLAALGALIWRRMRFGPFAWERRLAARRREKRAFLALERAIGGGSALALLSRAYAWLALRLPHQPRTLARLRAALPESAQALAGWEAQAFGHGAEGTAPRGLRHVFVRARRALASRGQTRALTELNALQDSQEETP